MFIGGWETSRWCIFCVKFVCGRWDRLDYGWVTYLREETVVAENVGTVDECFGGIEGGVGGIAFGANSRQTHYNSYLIILVKLGWYPHFNI